MDGFVNLHVHSHFSKLDGMPSPADIVNTVADMGQKYVALTDHGILAGIPSLYKAAKDRGITPIAGCEAYYIPNRKLRRDQFNKKYYHLIMFAENEVGYNNLIKMQSEAWNVDTKGDNEWDGGFFGGYPRVDDELLRKYSEGIIVTTSCLGSAVNSRLARRDYEGALEETKKLIDIFGKDNVYVEIQKHGLHMHEYPVTEEVLLHSQVKLAQELDLPLLATCDSHYCCQDDADHHDSLLATSVKKTKADSARFSFDGDNYFLHSAEQMLELFPEDEFPGAVSNTVELAERTSMHIPYGEKKYIMPHIKTEGMSEDEYLRKLVLEGAAESKRYGDINGEIPDEVMERINYELGIISGMNFSGYFLMVWTIINLMRKKGIQIGAGRGCLHPNTPVYVKDRGFIPVSDVHVGDFVIDADGKFSKVSASHMHIPGEGEQLIRFNRKGGHIVLTEKHKLLVADNENGDNVKWKKAYQVMPGDYIAEVGLDKTTYHMITSMSTEDAETVLYDLTVSGDPSFLTSFGTVHNSAPGSVAVYCLGITNLDPLEHSLFFERFLNPDRVSMPDIDIDVPKTRREEALHIMENEYGLGHVAHLSNYMAMGRKSVVERMAKVHGQAPTRARRISTLVDEYCSNHNKKIKVGDTTVEVGMELSDLREKIVPPGDIIRELNLSQEEYTKIINDACELQGTLYGYGVHASGIVITDEPVNNYFPTRVEYSTGGGGKTYIQKNPLPVCQFDGADTEALGGVKMDLLGLINIDECVDAERNIRLDLGESVDSSDLPVDDKEVYETLSRGSGGGVFQLGCLSGDTIIDGKPIREIYMNRNSPYNKTEHIPSVSFGKGRVIDNYIEDIVSSGVKETFLLRTTGGRKIRATANHMFFTTSGWKKLENLSTERDMVLVARRDSWEDTGGPGNLSAQNIIDAFIQLNPDHKKIGEPLPISLRNIAAYAQIVSPSGDFIVIVPDISFDITAPLTRYAEEDGKTPIHVFSYSQVMEDYQSAFRSMSKFPDPEGTEWDAVESIERHGMEETYDIFMRGAVNNYIANQFMVHNSSGMQSLMRRMKPSEFADISALIGLYRPGPMGQNTHNEYSDRKNGLSRVKYFHKDAKDILNTTYGLIVYQEDIMALSRKFAGFTGAEADSLRKAVAKKKAKAMEEQKAKFIPAVNERYGNNLGKLMWDTIEPFASYAFNKSHSAAYAVTVYRTAWLKTHYPAQFAGAVIDHTYNNKDKFMDSVAWIREEGVKINTPDINVSGLRTITDRDSVTLPLYVIGGFSEDSTKAIVDEREKNGKFTSVPNFVARCKISDKHIISLAKCGAFDSLGVSRAAVINNIANIRSVAESQKKLMKTKKGLFGKVATRELGTEDTVLDLTEAPESMVVNGKLVYIDEDLQSKWEREILGVFVGYHPYETLEKMKNPITRKMLKAFPPVHTFAEPQENVKFSAMITDVENRVSNSGNDFAKFSLETERGIVEGVKFKFKFPEDDNGNPMIDGSIVLVEASLDTDDFNRQDDTDDIKLNARCHKIKVIDVDKLKEEEKKWLKKQQ